MNNNIQYVNLEEGGVFVFGKWLKIGMSYEKVMDLFAEHIKSNNILDIPNHEGCACITLYDAEVFGFPLLTMSVFFENYEIVQITMSIDDGYFYEEASKHGINGYQNLTKYVAEKFNSTIMESLGDTWLKYFDKTFHYETDKYSFGTSYDRDMAEYSVKMKVK